ncbi:hypothetical protein OOT46_28395 [Aquabacterium sp. A7-Y]|uniref:hypothetical protein n=1 Tax=Aquabacterium sp. A7-Y TaxID=1349605 RepID=UPI00223D9770|nr:hypothetical protein [Aquabacterium sp. A7-Y]MCW7541722.1 hypothetical protein [Aquabacterium sp. A7-Y]
MPHRKARRERELQPRGLRHALWVARVASATIAPAFDLPAWRRRGEPPYDPEAGRAGDRTSRLIPSTWQPALTLEHLAAWQGGLFWSVAGPCPEEQFGQLAHGGTG